MCTVQYMTYGTIRDKTRDEIILTLKEHEKLRYGELSEIIVVKKNICSDRIFRETLSYMTNSGLVKKIVIARNNTLYTIDSKITPLADEDVNDMIENIDDLKKETDEILKVISSDADDSDKSNEIMKYLLLLSMYEMQMTMLSHVSGKSKLTKYVNDITKYKKTVLESLNTKSSSMFSEIGALVYFKLFMESIKQVPEEIESFANSINDIKNSKEKTH